MGALDVDRSCVNQPNCKLDKRMCGASVAFVCSNICTFASRSKGADTSSFVRFLNCSATDLYSAS